MPTQRDLAKVFSGIKASDGDGVQLTRIIGSQHLNSLDPFLLFDAFGSDQAQDYIGGFPAHPHRGFETVTYMLAGKMRHQDSAGNAGVIEAGDIQWMTAGRGIIHSEMPEQTQGLLAGFQLWVNLPASQKMTEPRYQEFSSAQIPVETHPNGTQIKVIAGDTRLGSQGVIENAALSPIYWDIHLPDEQTLSETIPAKHHAFLYVIEGKIQLSNNPQPILSQQIAVLTQGEQISIRAQQKSRFLLIAGKPLNEPIARAGPFVMNTREEINQAFADYQSGRLA